MGGRRREEEELLLSQMNSLGSEILASMSLSCCLKFWHLPQCPSSDEWIKKMWHMYTMEYYSAIKRNEMGVFVVRWMELESVIQSEVSQKEKNKYSMLTHIYGI